MNGFVLTACQRKGGVGRSTLLYNLAGALAKRGLRTLLVDLDPQASVTQICLGPEIVDTLPAHRSIVSLIDDALFGTVEAITQPAGIPGVDLIPGSNALARFNHPEPEKTGALQFSLQECSPMSGASTTRSCATLRQAWRRCRGCRRWRRMLP